MNTLISNVFIVVFSVFLGSQITEGCLLVPYWKSLAAVDFYMYYSEFGPSIGKFYTILTIAAVLIPLYCSIYFYHKKSKAFINASISLLFALLVIGVFYLYFKGTNQLFYHATLSPSELENELRTWERIHWLRVSFEFISLIFLILSINSSQRSLAKDFSKYQSSQL